jgi:hypothetical protein
VSFLRTLRKLVLGETWALPAGVAVALGIAGAGRLASGPGGWWHHGGGVLLAALLVVALGLSLRQGLK